MPRAAGRSRPRTCASPRRSRAARRSPSRTPGSTPSSPRRPEPPRSVRRRARTVTIAGMDDSRPDWHTDAHPELRPGPPWVMEEMVAAQPGLAAPLLSAPARETTALAELVGGADGPVTVVGCGTSEHAAMAVAALLDAALGEGDRWPPRAVARQALEAATAPQRGGVCIAIS